MWIQNVTLFGNVEAASQMWEVHWLSKIDVMFEATATFYVQMFFCRRLWVISRNGYILGICFVLYVFGLASAAVDTFFLFANLEFAETTAAGWGALHLGVVVCGDLLLTGSTIFYLLVSVRYPHCHPFAIVINSLLRLTVQSAAPSAICALINFSVTMRLYLAGTFIPELLMIDFITNTILPQMYAWSALWTLNSREGIWVAVDNRPYTVSLGTAMVAPGLQVSEPESGTKSVVHVQCEEMVLRPLKSSRGILKELLKVSSVPAACSPAVGLLSGDKEKCKVNSIWFEGIISGFVITEADVRT
ncbi:hypothetical protein C8R45DRAFT_1022424 [Mycena sanguinolenta]|nr:hypothetical protein C8R45DRAFT_1022424 [Mycena sanguinolenta]